MASPVGHTLAGYLGYRLMPTFFGKAPSKGWMLGAIALANLPDLDFIPGLLMGNAFAFHRRGTHTVLAALLVGIVVAIAAALSQRLRSSPREHQWEWLWWGLWATMMYLGHLGLDLLMADRIPPQGLQLLWPFSVLYFPSPLTLIPGLQFDPVLSWHNVRVVATEGVLLGPLIAWAGGLLRRPQNGRNPLEIER